MGQTAYGYAGLSTGQWVSALEQRLTSANTAFPGETWDNYSPDNPRILIVPMVTYTGGTGSGASYRIEQFGAFWLQSIKGTGNPKGIVGQFMGYGYEARGGRPNPGGSSMPMVMATSLYG